MTLVQQLADGAAALEPAANAANGWRTLGQICLALDEGRLDGGTPAIRIWATSGPMACLKGPQVPGRLEKGNTALLLRPDQLRPFATDYGIQGVKRMFVPLTELHFPPASGPPGQPQ